MKRAIGLVLIFFTFSLAKGQSYHPMLGDSNTWYVATRYFEAEGTTIYVSEGDTILNGNHYKFEYTYNDTLRFFVALIGFLREDTILQKVYLIKNLNYSVNSNSYYHSTAAADSMAIIDSTEHILYDFSLVKGDSIYLNINTYNASHNSCCFGGPSDTLIDTSVWFYVDSVSMTNTFIGSRKMFYLSPKICDNIYQYDCITNWVEQIGALNGPYWNVYLGEENSLNCAFKDTSYEYNNVSVDGPVPCYFLVSGINSLADSERINIYPNPVDKELSISITNPANLCKGTIVDIMGKQLSTFTTSQSKTTIDVSYLPAGIYTLIVQSGEKIYVKKIVKISD